MTIHNSVDLLSTVLYSQNILYEFLEYKWYLYTCISGLETRKEFHSTRVNKHALNTNFCKCPKKVEARRGEAVKYWLVSLSVIFHPSEIWCKNLPTVLQYIYVNII